MVLKIGEKIHIMARRAFETDIGRHFVGVVKKVGDNVARVEGHVFVFDTRSSQYVRKPETRTIIISLTDGRYIINVIPPSTKIDKGQKATIWWLQMGGTSNLKFPNLDPISNLDGGLLPKPNTRGDLTFWVAEYQASDALMLTLNQ
jgi:hypothetical protein